MIDRSADATTAVVVVAVLSAAFESGVVELAAALAVIVLPFSADAATLAQVREWKKAKKAAAKTKQD